MALPASGEDLAMSERTYNRALGRLRLLALYALVALLLFFARPTLLSIAAGLGFVIAGEAIRFWASGHLFKTQELITSGPYRYTRNPLYLGRLLIFTGLALMVNLPYGGTWIALVLGWALFFGYYLRRKEKVEPARLREVHGEPYERYFRSVPALFPTLRPYTAASQGSWSASRMKMNREYMMVAGLLLITLFLFWRAFPGSEPGLFIFGS